MSNSNLPPIKGASTSNPLANDRADISSTREITQSAMESDRALVKPDAQKKSSKSDIESGRIQKSKVSPASDEQTCELRKEADEKHQQSRSDASKMMRMKAAVCVALLVILAAIIVLVTMDLRASDAIIEKPMLKVFSSFPTDKTVQKALHWQAKNPFPLKELISNGTISIDTAFKVDQMIIKPTYVKLGNVVYRPDTPQTQLTLNYIGQLDTTVSASGIGRIYSSNPPFMYEGEFTNNGQPNGFGRFISENTLIQGFWQGGKVHGTATMIQNYFSQKSDQEKKDVCQLASSNPAQEHLSLTGTWVNNLFKGKTLTNQNCLFIGVTYPFMIKTDKSKFDEAVTNFDVVPMARFATTYEKNLQKMFSEEKITLVDDTYKMKAYQKEIGDFEVSALINRQFIKLEELQIGTIKRGDKNTGFQYQGQIKNGVASGIGRIVSAQYGIYEGVWAEGKPNGFGSVVNQHTNHYEGIVSYKESDSEGMIMGNGVGTLYLEKEEYKGTFGLGYLKIPDDKDMATKALICDFQQGFKSIGYDGMTTDETTLNNEFVASQDAMKTQYGSLKLPQLQYVSYLTTGKTVLKTPMETFTLKDKSVYKGQGDVSTTTAFGFGLYAQTIKSLTNTYMGQFLAGVPSGYGLLVQYNDVKKTISAYRGQFVDGVPAGEGTGWNWDAPGKTTSQFVGTAFFSEKEGIYSIQMTNCQQYYDANGEVSCKLLPGGKPFPINIKSTTNSIITSIDASTVEPAAAKPADKPATGGDDATKPATGGGGATKPATGGDDASKPATGGDDASKPATGGDDATKPATGGGGS